MSGINKNDVERDLIARASAVLPGGTFGNLAGDIVIAEGSGGRVRDVSGNEYVDFLLGSGPMFIGHSNPEVNAAVLAQIPRGTTFFANNEYGIRLAEAIRDAVACAEKVRFTSSGSEATLYAMRVARAHRKRDKILKFEGGFHGMSDYALMSMAPKRPANYPLAIPDTPGIPSRVRDEMLIAPFNDAETARALIKEYADEIAGVIVEPFQRLLKPKPGFLQAVREATAEAGIPLIFDEIVTGFRFAYGGAQAYYGVTPDMCTLGKIVGGGFPLAAVVGSAELMAHFDRGASDDANFLPQIGTLSGNPVASVAGLATLEVLRRPGAYEKVFATGKTLMAGLDKAMREAGVPAQVIGEPPLFDVFFTGGPVESYRATLEANAERMKVFNRAMRENGVLKGDSKFYVSLAHDEADIAQTLKAFEAAAKALKG